MHPAMLVSAMPTAKTKACAHMPVLAATVTVFVVLVSMPMHQISFARYTGSIPMSDRRYIEDKIYLSANEFQAANATVNNKPKMLMN
jgi:hypothetical protein